MTHSHDTATPALSVEREARPTVNEYAADYYFAGDGGDHTPTEGERAMIEDAINGYLAEIAAPAPNPSPAAKGGEAGALKLVRMAFVQARGALRLDAMVDREGNPYGTTVEALRAIAEAEDALAALATPSPQPADAVREALLNARKALLSEHWHEKSQLISQIDAALASDPAPAGEAVEPVKRVAKAIHDSCSRQDIFGYLNAKVDCDVLARAAIAAYAHPAPEDTARLREDLERVTRELEEETALRVGAIDRMKVAERDRDDARKALETAAEDERDRLFAKIMENGKYLLPAHDQAIRQFLQLERATLPADRAAARSASREGASDE